MKTSKFIPLIALFILALFSSLLTGCAKYQDPRKSVSLEDFVGSDNYNYRAYSMAHSHYTDPSLAAVVTFYPNANSPAVVYYSLGYVKVAASTLHFIDKTTKLPVMLSGVASVTPIGNK